MGPYAPRASAKGETPEQLKSTESPTRPPEHHEEHEDDNTVDEKPEQMKSAEATTPMCG